VVALVGEAGVGKSRLLETFRAQTCDEQCAALTCRCSPYETNRAFYPVFEALERFFETRREETHEQKLAGLQKELERYGLAAAEIQILMANLLPVSQDSLDNLSYGSTQLQRQKTQRVILKLLEAIATQKPLLLMVEDLHWADAATLELLDLLVAEITNSPIMACFAFRPKYLAPWQEGERLTRIALQPLPPKEIAAMIDALAGKALPREMLQQLVVKTDGVPLFIEELTKMVLESGLLIEHKNHFEMAGPLPALAIPTSLHDSLMARLDRMATVKDVAQLGATIGREFSYELIHLVSQLDHQTLKNELGRLVEAGLLYKDGAPANEKYVFKHALIRDTAYETLLKSTRQLYHVRIAQVLVEYFPRLIEARPELVAYHYTEARSAERAAPFWLHAGQRASRRWAPDEAMVYFNQGLALMKEMPESAEKAQLELECLIALGAVLVATKGYVAAEVELTYARARALAMQLGDHPHLYPAVLGLAIYYLIRGEFQAARELAEQALRLATTVQDPAVLVEAHYVLGTTLFHLGYLT
jgi:predicted ATPase